MQSRSSKTLFNLTILFLTLSILISGCTVYSTLNPTTIPASPTPTQIITTNTPQASVTTPNPTIVAPTPTATILPSSNPGMGNSITIHFINVGQGDSELIKIGDKVMLIDGGPTSAGSTLTSYLRSQGVNTIDVLVSTHPHEDHIGGLLTVLREFPVKQVIDSGVVTSSQTYESYLTLIDQKDIPYRVAERGQTIDISPDISIQILSPPSSPISSDDLNQNSIVLKVTYGKVRFMFMGDAGFDAENSIMPAGFDLSSDIIKVAHHGSKYASSATFLSKVKPSISVIEVGAGNSYGHPTPETLDRLAAVGSTVYRTDLNGNIVITSDGSSYSVSTQRGTANAPMAVQQATSQPTTTNTITATPAANAGVAYIGNSNTMKFHLSTCRYVSSIAVDHIVHLSSREEAINKGYVPCKVCNP